MDTSYEDEEKMKAFGLRARAIHQKLTEIKHYSIEAKKMMTRVKSIEDISTRAYTYLKSRDAVFFGEFLEIQHKAKSLLKSCNVSE